MEKSKIFCIGFHKTGTSSVKNALQRLGFTVTGPNGVQDVDIARNVYTMVDALVPQFDAFQDNPWPVLYRYLDEKYPGSKFILTVRSSESWIKSQLTHFGSRTTPMREWIYDVGCPKGNEDRYIKRYEDHSHTVREYFKDRPGDLLVLDLTKGDGWDRLCTFLKKEVPDEPFPHKNKSSSRKPKMKPNHPLVKKIKSLMQRAKRLM